MYLAFLQSPSFGATNIREELLPYKCNKLISKFNNPFYSGSHFYRTFLKINCVKNAHNFIRHHYG